MNLALQSLGLLVLDRFKILVAKLCQGKFTLRTIDLALFVFEYGEPPLGQMAADRSKAAADFLAAGFDARIINAVGRISIKRFSNLLKSSRGPGSGTSSYFAGENQRQS